MRTRDTSLESWELITPKLGDKHRTIYKMIAQHSNKTASELYEIMKGSGVLKNEFDSNTRSRFTELRDMGCIEEVCRRRCTTSNRKAIEWVVTGKPPIKNWRRESKGIGRRPLEDEILDLKEMIKSIRAFALKYARHDSYCMSEPCTCGFDKAHFAATKIP